MAEMIHSPMREFGHVVTFLRKDFDHDAVLEMMMWLNEGSNPGYYSLDVSQDKKKWHEFRFFISERNVAFAFKMRWM